jgi:hypothetical protein
MNSSTYKVLHGPKTRFFEDFSPQISPGSLIGYAVSSKKTMTICIEDMIEISKTAGYWLLQLVEFLLYNVAGCRWNISVAAITICRQFL